MTLTRGARLGPYEIVAPLGAGGMGEVFRARDTRLHRDVAIKVLPESFATDPDRLARFQREAQTLAALNHPNIAHIHGLEESRGVHALVMELVEGEDLSQRLTRGAIPLDEALPIAKQIAEALEAAHEQGIIHRDLKPANIKLRPDGTVKVLDFGLAKALEPVGGAPHVTQSPTITTPAMMTGVGMILGTAAYMAPEQARGKAVDKRADIWAFGCVLFEMLTGRPAFEAGESVSDVIAAILKNDADWNRLSTGTPASIRRLLRRCLQKERTERLQHIGDARIEISEAQAGSHVDAVAAPPASPMHKRLAWISALALVAVAAVAAIGWSFRSKPSAAEMRVEITTPQTGDPASLAISPDGLKLVFVAYDNHVSRLWVRSLDAESARPLAGTDGAKGPFWSPNSRSVGFFADGKLKRIDIERGSVQSLADARAGSGGGWNNSGTILFSPSTASSLFRISESGGTATTVKPLSPGQSSHRLPQFLPDGRHFLYRTQGRPEESGVYIGQLDNSQTRRLFDAESAAVFTAPGYLLFVRGGTLLAQRFDKDQLAVTGDPFAVAERVTVAGSGMPAVSASDAGTIVYRAGGSSGALRQFVWFDRTGRAIEKVGDPFDGSSPSLSPDGHQVALYRPGNGNLDIWLFELGRGLLRRMTTSPTTETFPIWSPDGHRLVFASNRNGMLDLFVKPPTEGGSEELLLASPQGKTPLDWSRDGRFLLYRSADPNTGMDLWALPLDGDKKPFPIVRTKFEERDGQFSPDGKWIAYQSDDSGHFEVFVQPFPGPGDRQRVSSDGGAQVRWRATDGRELYYIGLDERLMSVPIRFRSNGLPPEIDKPVPLFATRIGGALNGPNRQEYVVSLDGQRFLMNTVVEDAVSPISIILNWKPKP